MGYLSSSDGPSETLGVGNVDSASTGSVAIQPSLYALFGRPDLAQGWTLRQSQVLWGRLELCSRSRTDAYRHCAGARMTLPSEGAKALDGGCRGRIHDHILRELFPGADPGGDHDLHATMAT